MKSLPPAAENAAPQMPERESQLIEIFAKARKQYDSGHAGVKSKDVRVGLQIQVIEFMEAGQDTKDWVGTVKTRGTSPEGDAWITIEIADGITVSTWQTHFFDQNQGTLIPNYSPLFERAHSLRIGQSVVFSGKIIESVTSNDEEMIVRPQLIARFTALKATD